MDNLPVLTIAAWQCLFDEAPSFDEAVRSRRLSCIIEEATLSRHSIEKSKAAHAYDLAASIFEKRYKEGKPISNDIRVRLIFDYLGLQVNEHSVSRLRRALERTHSDIGMHLLPGAKHFLSKVSCQYRLALLSDTWMTPGASIDGFLERAGLLSFFELRVYSDEIGRHKVDGTAFLHTAELFGVPASSITHVGDLWKSDVVGAHKAGVSKIFFIDHPNHPVEQHTEKTIIRPHCPIMVNSLSEVTTYLTMDVKNPK